MTIKSRNSDYSIFDKISNPEMFKILRVDLLFLFTFLTLSACSPIFESTEKISSGVCSKEISGTFIQSKMYQKYIVLEQGNRDYVVYDLTQQATTCDTDVFDNLLFLFDSDDTEKIAEGLRFSAASDPKMTIKNFSGKHSNFQKIVENKCEQMKFNFLFGLDTDDGPVIGCQTSPNTKSAIMFRKDEKNKNEIIIAALSFYEPLLNKFID